MKTGICSKRSQLLTFLRAGLGLGLLTIAALAIAVALPTGAEAVNTCNGSFQVNYISPPTPNFPDVGSTVKIELTVGANTINGGTQMTVTALRFDQACLAAGDLTTCATTQKDPGAGVGGAPVSYAGDATITTTCAGITWASNLPAGGTSPNQLVFTPTPSLVIPAANPNFCTLSFNYTLVNHSGNVDPNQIIQIAGFNQTSSSTGDAVCNNATSSGASGTGTYSACPVCTPANECNTAACDTDTGACVQTPKSPSTACTDTDGDNCSAAGCETVEGLGQCVQTHVVTPCTPANECNTAACDASHVCVQTPKAPSTACTDTDGDNCTAAGCETVAGVGQCVQTHVVTPCTPANECNTAACDASHVCVQTPKAPSTACADTDGNICTVAGCETVDGIGQCVQAHTVGCTEWCSPGYWKNIKKHGQNWTNATPNQLFNTVNIGGTFFENAFPGKTMLDVLSTGGGCLNRLGRFTVGMFLDAGKLNTNFTQLQVIQNFNAVFPGTCAQYDALADQFEQAENCPLN